MSPRPGGPPTKKKRKSPDEGVFPRKPAVVPADAAAVSLDPQLRRGQGGGLSADAASALLGGATFDELPFEPPAVPTPLLPPEPPPYRPMAQDVTRVAPPTPDLVLPPAELAGKGVESQYAAHGFTPAQLQGEARNEEVLDANPLLAALVNPARDIAGRVGEEVGRFGEGLKQFGDLTGLSGPLKLYGPKLLDALKETERGNSLMYRDLSELTKNHPLLARVLADRSQRSASLAGLPEEEWKQYWPEGKAPEIGMGTHMLTDLTHPVNFIAPELLGLKGLPGLRAVAALGNVVDPWGYDETMTPVQRALMGYVAPDLLREGGKAAKAAVPEALEQLGVPGGRRVGELARNIPAAFEKTSRLAIAGGQDRGIAREITSLSDALAAATARGNAGAARGIEQEMARVAAGPDTNRGLVRMPGEDRPEMRAVDIYDPTAKDDLGISAEARNRGEAAAVGLGEFLPPPRVRAHAALQGMKDEVRRLATTPVTPEQILKARKAALAAPVLEFRQVQPEEFARAVDAASVEAKAGGKVGDTLSDYTADDYVKMRTFLSPDGKTGYAIKSDGDLVSVFNVGGVRGAGAAAVISGVENGATKLDAFEPFLGPFYHELGFKPYKVSPNWTPGGAPVVYMRYEGGDPAMLRSRIGTFGDYQRPLAEYDESHPLVAQYLAGRTSMDPELDQIPFLIGREGLPVKQPALRVQDAAVRDINTGEVVGRGASHQEALAAAGVAPGAPRPAHLEDGYVFNDGTFAKTTSGEGRTPVVRTEDPKATPAAVYHTIGTAGLAALGLLADGDEKGGTTADLLTAGAAGALVSTRRGRVPMPDLTVFGAGIIREGDRSFARFASHMENIYGPNIRPRLPQLYTAAFARAMSVQNQVPDAVVRDTLAAARELIKGKKSLVGATPELRLKRAMRIGVKEAVDAIVRLGDARRWYKEDIDTMERFVTWMFPETNDPSQMAIFKSFLAITSNGNDPVTNFKSAVEIWKRWKRTGEWAAKAPDLPGHVRLAIHDAQVKKIGKLVDEMGPADFARYMLGNTDEPMRTFHDEVGPDGVGRKVRDTRQVRTAVHVLNDKIGRFYLNTMGVHDEVTVDLWAVRWWFRMQGYLRSKPKKTPVKVAWDNERMTEARFLASTTGEVSENPEGGKEIYTELRENLVDDEGNVVKKPLTDFEGTPLLDKRGKPRTAPVMDPEGRIIEELDDQPNEAEKREIRATMSAIAERVSKVTGAQLDGADIQALLWYYEKELFRLKGAKDSGKLSFADAAARYVAGEQLEYPDRPPLSWADFAPAGADRSRRGAAAAAGTGSAGEDAAGGALPVAGATAGGAEGLAAGSGRLTAGAAGVAAGATALAGDKEDSPYAGAAAAVFAGRPRFYSRLVQSVDKGPAKTTGKKWLDLLKGASHKEERAWTGIEGWLSKHLGDSLTREDISAAVNPIRIEELVADESARTRFLEMSAHRDSLELELGMLIGRMDVTPNMHPRILYGRYDRATRGGPFGEVAPLNEEVAHDVAKVFANEAYRGWSGHGQRPVDADRDKLEALAFEALKAREDARRLQKYENPRYKGWSSSVGGTNYREVRLTLPDMEGRGFKTNHFPGDKNVVLHLRLQDVQGPNGERILLVDEIQSDWAQEGRKLGFQTPEQVAVEREIASLREQHGAAKEVVRRLEDEWRIGVSNRDEYDKAVEEVDRLERLATEARTRQTKAGPIAIKRAQIQEEMGEVGRKFASSTDAEEKAALRRRYTELDAEYDRLADAEVRERNAVPSMPFKQTNDWLGLAWKRVIDEAVDGGYDRIAWAPGSEHVRRYGTEEIRWEPWRDDPPGFRVTAVKQAGGVGIHGEDLSGLGGAGRSLVESPKDLVRLLRNLDDGMDRDEAQATAEKLWARMQKEPTGMTRPRQEGMEGFYDKMVPEWIRSYAKKNGVELSVEGSGVASHTLFRGGAPGGPVEPGEYPSFAVTPELKNLAAKGFQVLGAGGLMLDGDQQDENAPAAAALGALWGGRARARAAAALDPVERILAHVDKGPGTRLLPHLPGAGEFQEAVLRAYTSVLDEIAPIGVITRDAREASPGHVLPDNMDAETAARAAAGYMGYAESMLEHGVHAPSSRTYASRGLQQIYSEVGGRMRELTAYRVAKRALELMDPGRPGGAKLTGFENEAADLQATVARFANDVDIQRWHRELKDYHYQTLKLLENEGVLRPLSNDEVAQGYTSVADLIRDTGNLEYSPFFRTKEQADAAGFGPQTGGTRRFANLVSPVKRLKGSEKKLIDLPESDVRMTFAYANIVMRQRVSNGLAEIARNHPNEWIKPIRTPMQKISFAKDQLHGQVDDQVLDAIPEEFFQIWTKRPLRNTENIISVMGPNGREFYQVEPLLYESVMGLAPENIPGLIRFMSTPARWLRAGVTLMPDFAWANLTRDTLMAGATSSNKGLFPLGMARAVYDGLRGLSTIMVANTPKASMRAAKQGMLGAAIGALAPTDDDKRLPFAATGAVAGAAFGLSAPRLARGFGKGVTKQLAPDQILALYKSSGADFAAYLSMDRRAVQDAIRNLKSGGKSLAVTYNPVAALGRLNEMYENATRIGEFRRSLDNQNSLAPGAVTRAGVAARDVSTDFKRHGLSRAISWLRPAAAFWNARIQGIDKIRRAVAEHPAKVMGTLTTTVTLPSIALYLVNRDDKEYWDRPLWERNMFWMVPLPSTTDPATGEEVHGGFLRVPKPFELGLAFGSLPERFIESFDPNNPHRGGLTTLSDQVWSVFMTQLAEMLLPLPTVLTPLLENKVDYDMFLGRRLHNPYESQDMDPNLRGRERSSELARRVSDAMVVTTEKTSRVPMVGAIAKWLQMTPPEIDNVFRDWGGGMGREAVRYTDMLLRNKELRGSAPAMQGADYPLTGRFHARVPNPSGEGITQFYDLYNKLQGKEQSIKKWADLGYPEKSATLLERNIGWTAFTETMRETASVLADLRQSRQTIADSPGLSPDEKRVQMDEITRTMSELATDIMTTINSAHREMAASMKGEGGGE